MTTIAENLKTALALMKEEGRTRFKPFNSQSDADEFEKTYSVVYPDRVGYCALGAITAARTGKRGHDIKGIWEVCPETLTVARAIMRTTGVTDEDWDLDSDADLVNAVACYNDDTTDDEKIFSVFAKAIELAEATVNV